MIELAKLVEDVAAAVERVDHQRPQAVGSRTGRTYQPGIGPHSERQTITMVVDELARTDPAYASHAFDVPYPESARQRCDWCLGVPSDWDWAIEAKLLRLFGDNGKPNDNMLTHVLSPYPAHRSALTDCDKLAASTLGRRAAVMIVAYDYDGWDVELAITAFETLVSRRVTLGDRQTAQFGGLVHAVHRRGGAFAWEINRAAT